MYSPASQRCQRYENRGGGESDRCEAQDLSGSIGQRRPERNGKTTDHDIADDLRHDCPEIRSGWWLNTNVLRVREISDRLWAGASSAVDLTISAIPVATTTPQKTAVTSSSADSLLPNEFAQYTTWRRELMSAHALDAIFPSSPRLWIRAQ